LGATVEENLALINELRKEKSTALEEVDQLRKALLETKQKSQEELQEAKTTMAKQVQF
jgi:uncharacterized coiled-coil DUF342 family protein